LRKTDAECFTKQWNKEQACSYGHYTKFNENPEGTQARKPRPRQEGYVSLQ